MLLPDQLCITCCHIYIATGLFLKVCRVLEKDDVAKILKKITC